MYKTEPLNIKQPLSSQNKMTFILLLVIEDVFMKYTISSKFPSSSSTKGSLNSLQVLFAESKTPDRHWLWRSLHWVIHSRVEPAKTNLFSYSL